MHHPMTMAASAHRNQSKPWPPQPTAEHQVTVEAEPSGEADLDTAWSAEIRDEPSCESEPEPDMPEASAEI